MFFRKSPLTKNQEKQLISAIQKAELKTSGEIRVHFDKTLSIDPLERAKEVFVKLKMHETKERNGILFYVNIKHHEFAIWGDDGINQKVPTNFWSEIKSTAFEHFAKNEIIEGLEKGILMCGEQLKAFFPIQEGDRNELSNEISY